jgi:NADPH:quinone reductase-like Zn-dependent oxidoreductase
VKAAIVRELGRPPSYGDFEDPTVRPGETMVSVTAAAVSPLVRSRASGEHYTAGASLPFVPGIDGVGRTADGRRVFFAFPRPPFGSLAALVPVASHHLVDLPDDLDDVTAAAAANPGMSCWVPLTQLAPVRSGESVLVNGATGTAGRMAVQVAKFLGASKVIATGRDETKLRELSGLGADILLPLRPPMEAFRDAVRTVAREARVGVVLDYLWGPSAEAILAGLQGPDAPRGASRVRFVQVGNMAGPTISLASTTLRSSGVEILGSGLGSSTLESLFVGMSQFLQTFPKARFQVVTEAHPLSEVERAWESVAPEKRLVFTVP